MDTLSGDIEDVYRVRFESSRESIDRYNVYIVVQEPIVCQYNRNHLLRPPLMNILESEKQLLEQ